MSTSDKNPSSNTEERRHLRSGSRSFLSLLWASMQVCLLLGAILGFFIGLNTFLSGEGDISELVKTPLAVAVGAALLGTAFALPVILIGSALSGALAKRGKARRSTLCIVGAMLGGVYGYLLGQFTNSDILFWLFAAGGGLAGLFVQPETVRPIGPSSKCPRTVGSANKDACQERTAALPEGYLKRVRLFAWLFLVGAILTTTLAGLNRFYLASGHIDRDSKRVHQVKINDEELWIPKAYFKSRIPVEVDQRDVLLIMLFPEFEPLPDSPRRLRENDDWYRSVMVLIGNPTGRKTLAEIAQSHMESFRATQLRGREFDLLSFTQPNGIVDSRDIWIEGEVESPRSVIECSIRHSEVSHPQCTHYARIGEFWINISYDKRLLPQWRQVIDATSAKITSFER